jgi:hypothetical protein
MTKQMKAALAAMLMVGTLPMMAQTSQTDVVKVAPGQTKKTVIHRKNGATDTVISEGTSGTVKHKAVHHVAHKPAVKEHVETATERQIRELEAKQAAQQAQIDALTSANAAKDAALAQAQQTAQSAQQQAQSATSQAQSVQATVQQNSTDVQSLKSTVTDLASTSAGLASTIASTKTDLTEKIESPTTIHYKGVTITPIAFFAAEGVYRTRAINSGLDTPLNTTPFPGSNEGHISELNFSGRQSRLGGRFEGNAGPYKLTGYFEADFLSSGTTSNNNQSNSYTLRQRVIWGKGETKSGFAVTGGQIWSLATENGKSTDASTEKLPNTIDPQYHVGFSWERQPGFRVQQKFSNPILGNAVTVAISAEQAQIQLAGTTGAPVNFIYAGTGQGGGLYNAFSGTYTNNVAPDMITKFAFDTKTSHIEIGGLARFFRDEYYPILSYTGTTPNLSTSIAKSTKVGGGAFGSARVSASKYVDVAVQIMGGSGVGRYGNSQLGDVTVKPDGTFEPVKNYHGLASLETHPSKKLDLYAYYGEEYNQRTYYVAPDGVITGSAPPTLNNSGCYALTLGTPTSTGAAPGAVANCGEPTKHIEEGTLGFTYKVVSSPKYGTLRYQGTYSYLTKETWAGLPANGGTKGISGRATNNLIYISMRYYIP